MAFIKLQTDAFLNQKVRRLDDAGFRLWVYLLGQAWIEGPGKPAGTVRLRGIFAKDESQALDRVARVLGDAAGTFDGGANDLDVRPGQLNQIENVGLIHIATEEVGTAVGTTVARPNHVPDTVWDIEISIHDWAHHNPRKAPSHTTEGEAERKRKYRSQKKNTSGANGASSPKRPNGVVPSVPTTDQDKDLDSDKDSDSQPTATNRLAGESLLMRSLRERLTAALGLPALIHAGSPETQEFIQAQLDACGLECLVTDCRKIADLSKAGVPSSLNFFPGWLRKMPVPKVAR